MSRDYKTPPKPARSRGSPMLVGLVIGLLIGLAIALGVALYINKVPAPFLPKEQPRVIEPVAVPEPARAKSPAVAERKPDTPSSANAAPGSEGEQPSGKPRFEFYGILAGKEEAAKEKDVAAAPKDEAAPAETYYLQLAALQDPADADNLKAELALAGIEAKIQTAELPDGKTWHRVRLGPFTSVEAIDEARARLKASQRTATLIKVKEKRAP